MKKITLNALAFATIFGFATLYSCSGEATTEETTTEVEAPIEEVVEETPTSNLDLAAGLEVYNSICMACHQTNGEGIPGAFPPLANSDYLLADKTRAIKQVLNGSEGEITVNGVVFNGVMPGQKDALNDQQIADVLTYVLNSWGNDGGTVTAEEVAAQR